MGRTISRRAALRVIGSTTAVASGWIAGFFPEISTASATGAPDIAHGRTPVLRRRTGATTRAVRAGLALGSAKGRVARQFLATSGFGTSEYSESADALWSDGEAIGTIDALVFHDLRGDKYAHLIRQTTTSGREVVGVALFAGAHPESRAVYDVVGDQMVFMATITRAADGSITVQAADGSTQTVGGRLTSSAKGPGLAALSPDVICTPICSWDCTFVCTWVCSAVLMETCIISALCGPLAPICFGGCAVAIIYTCGWNCQNVCGLSCSFWCHVLEQTAV
jgi:hypothetical protein